jgi:hypothetical protein
MILHYFRSILVELECKHRTAIRTWHTRLSAKRTRTVVEQAVQPRDGLPCSYCKAHQRPVRVIGTIRQRDEQKAVKGA